MNIITKQIQEDTQAILSTEAGKRFLGSIFYAAKLNMPGPRNDYQQGVRDLALTIANTLREVSPYGVAECEIAYAELLKRGDENGRTDYDNAE